MPDCFSKSEVTDFLNFMKLPDGTSVVSDDMMEYLTAYGFFTAPASTKYHGNYEGGLLEHSYMVTKFLLTLTQDNHLIWRKARSPFIVGMFHDLCKIDQYRHPVAGHIEEFNGGRTPIYNERAWEYNSDTLLKGHGDKSVIRPSTFAKTDSTYHIWKRSCENAEVAYFDLLNEGCTPQEARSVLPNSLKTEVVMTADLREWRHFCRMRCPVAAHPDMRVVANMLLTLLKQTYPVFFEDIEV